MCEHGKLANKALYLPTVDLVTHWEEFTTSVLPRYLRYVVSMGTDNPDVARV